MYIKKIIKGVRSKLAHYRRTHEKLSLARKKLVGNATPDANVIYFDVSSDRFTRHLFNLIMFFRKSNYTVVLNYNENFIRELAQYSERLLELPEIFFSKSIPAGSLLKFSDLQKEGHIYLDDNFFALVKQQQSLTYPFSVHPMYFITGEIDKISEYRNVVKNINVIFGGAIEKDYTANSIEQHFKLINRYKLMSYLLEQKDKLKIDLVKEKENVPVLSNPDQKNIVIVKSGKDHLIDFRAWFGVLSKSRFMLAPPGIKIPFCHNVIEAMALGVVPIIQYGHLFNPPLENGVNCLKFNTLGDLGEILADIENFSDDQVNNLSENVKAYYNEHLNPEAFVAKLINGGNNLQRLYIYGQYHSVENLSSSNEKVMA